MGVILDLGGAGVFGAGLGVGELGLIIPGAAGMGVGTIFLASGLGVWVSNQVKMNKIERGIPLSRRLKLEGLSPVVASREGAAPGLNAAFSF